MKITVWRVSKDRVFSGPYFPVFVLRKSSYSVQIRENKDQKKVHIWTIFTQWILKLQMAEVNSTPCHTCKMERFMKIVNGFQIQCLWNKCCTVEGNIGLWRKMFLEKSSIFYDKNAYIMQKLLTCKKRLYISATIARVDTDRENMPMFCVPVTAWTVSVFGVFRICIFPHPD